MDSANRYLALQKIVELGIPSPLVDLMANAGLRGKTVLYMLDALICAPSEGGRCHRRKLQMAVGSPQRGLRLQCVCLSGPGV